MYFRKQFKLALNFIGDRIATQPPATGRQEPEPLNQELEPEPLVVMDNKLLAGKNVLITGAGRNIGRSIAIEMAKQGANIFFTDIDERRLGKLEQELNSYEIRSRGFVSDVSETEDNESLFSALVQDGVSIDVLVNNVGIEIETQNLKDLDLKVWHRTFDTNVFGPIYLTNLISGMMIAKDIQGAIIFITSMHQWIIRGIPSYSASKASLGMIIKELALELAPHLIRVNGIAPGWVVEDEQGNTHHHKYTPLHHTSINPRYIGRAAVYLASDYFSKFTTGTMLKIDAGLMLHNHVSHSRGKSVLNSKA